MKYLKVLNPVNFSGCDDALNNLRSIANVINIDPDRELIQKNIVDCDAYIACMGVQLDKELIDLAKNLKVVCTPSTGTDHLDLKYLKAKGIVCFDLSKEYELINTFSATSELAFTLLLALNRKLFPAVSSVFRNEWGREDYSGDQLLGKTFGIIGLGRLGMISARIASGFGMNVIANDIVDKSDSGIEMVSIEEVFRSSDFISIHVHLNESTVNLIDERLLGLSKPNLILINTSRAAIINEEHLLSALKGKKIKAVGLDMINGEWLEDRTQHSLIQYAKENNNILITPHIGGATFESVYGARIFMANKLYTFLKEFNN